MSEDSAQKTWTYQCKIWCRHLFTLFWYKAVRGVCPTVQGYVKVVLLVE